jgi:hypothetical protein
LLNYLFAARDLQRPCGRSRDDDQSGAALNFGFDDGASGFHYRISSAKRSAQTVLSRARADSFSTAEAGAPACRSCRNELPDGIASSILLNKKIASGNGTQRQLKCYADRVRKKLFTIKKATEHANEATGLLKQSQTFHEQEKLGVLKEGVADEAVIELNKRAVSKVNKAIELTKRFIAEQELPKRFIVEHE